MLLPTSHDIAAIRGSLRSLVEAGHVVDMTETGPTIAFWTDKVGVQAVTLTRHMPLPYSIPGRDYVTTARGFYFREHTSRHFFEGELPSVSWADEGPSRINVLLDIDDLDDPKHVSVIYVVSAWRKPPAVLDHTAVLNTFQNFCVFKSLGHCVWEGKLSPESVQLETGYLNADVFRIEGEIVTSRQYKSPFIAFYENMGAAAIMFNL